MKNEMNSRTVTKDQIDEEICMIAAQYIAENDFGIEVNWKKLDWALAVELIVEREFSIQEEKDELGAEWTSYLENAWDNASDKLSTTHFTI